MTSFVLKILACAFMLIAHVGFCLLPKVEILRNIGRLAFPLFAFQVAIGFSHTRNKSKYLMRMFIFAVVSQIPFMLFRHRVGYDNLKLNIGFSFFISLLCLYIIDLFKEKKQPLILLLILPLLYSAYKLNVDYSFFAPLWIIVFYLFGQSKKDFPWLLVSMFFVTASYVIMFKNVNQLYCLISLLFIAFYNGKKGPGLKYAFYIFYPLHLMILTLLNYLFL